MQQKTREIAWALVLGTNWWDVFAETKPNSSINIRDYQYKGRVTSTNDGSLIFTHLTKKDQGIYRAGVSKSDCSHFYSLRVYTVEVAEEQVVEETVLVEVSPPSPPAKKYRVATCATEEGPEGNSKKERQELEQQLQEANLRACEFRQQLREKEQEAEAYRVKLESLERQQLNGDRFTAVEDGDTIIVSAEELAGVEVTEVETVEHHSDIPPESAT